MGIPLGISGISAGRFRVQFQDLFNGFFEVFIRRIQLSLEFFVMFFGKFLEVIIDDLECKSEQVFLIEAEQAFLVQFDFQLYSEAFLQVPCTDSRRIEPLNFAEDFSTSFSSVKMFRVNMRSSMMDVTSRLRYPSSSMLPMIWRAIVNSRSSRSCNKPNCSSR